MKNPVITIIVTMLVSVAATAGFFLAKPDPQASDFTKLEAEVKAARDETAKLKIERDLLVAEVKSAAAAGPTTSSLTSTNPATGTLAVGTTAKTDNATPGKINSGVRAMLPKTQEVQIDMTYGKLFHKLSLNAEELDNFKGLLGARVGAQMDASMKLMNPATSAAERQAIKNQFAASKTQSDADIRKFLNNEDDYKTYQQWEDTQPERMALELGSSAFANAGVPLSDEQREQLVGTMADVRMSPSTVPGLENARDVTPGSLTPEGIAKQLERHKLDDARVREDATKFLTPEQIEALKKMQDQMLVMKEAGMKMSGQMFGGGKK